MELPVGARPLTSAEDVLLGFELACALFIWLLSWHIGFEKAPPVKRRFFVAYALNLAGSSIWCFIGTYIHTFEPLPAERSFWWLTFLLFGEATPALFPLVCLWAFPVKRDANPVMQSLASASLAVPFGVAVLTGADLSLGGRMPTEMAITPWHKVDGRSVAGSPHGIEFDLLSSMPLWRGDALFMLSIYFMMVVAFSTHHLYKVGWSAGATDTDEVSVAKRDSARSLCFLTASMFINCTFLLYMPIVFEVSMQTAFHAFHFGQAVIMAGCFFYLRRVLLLPSPKKAS
eukprot:TRINITY_DN45203_c0_g1_i1.p1 TRINITY_DN45203_c0_g1~~TRINITY_DN45203_c0_g1_i1.p1  ORF type:complete len:299 (-),score=36.68 TRINITY_DN45203_c0_g1_i1:42-902(-)